MIQSLLIIAVIIGIFWAIRYLNRHPSANKKKPLITIGLYATAALLILLVMTGRAHWLAAAIGASLPFLQKIVGLGFRFFPFLSNFKKQQGQAKNSTGSMNNDVEKAMQVFGLETIANTEQVVQRHRELMQKNHPDRGGSDFLAAQINDAKEVLLKHIKSKA